MLRRALFVFICSALLTGCTDEPTPASDTSSATDADAAAADTTDTPDTAVVDTADGSPPDTAKDSGSAPDSAPNDTGTDDDTSVSEDATDGADGESGTKERVQLEDVTYSGAFRLPAGEFGASSMNYAQGPLEYDASDDTIYIVGHSHDQAVAEFGVPAITESETIGDLEMAPEPDQPFATLLGRVDNPQEIDRIAGMEVVDGELFVNAFEYYDAPGDNTHTTLVLRDANGLAGGRVDGYFEMQGRAHASGWISPIPDGWRDTLGGTHISGNSSGTPIISRTSVGPSAFVFTPGESGTNGAESGAITTTALLDFSLDHPLHEDLSNEQGDNDLWTHLSRATYGFIPPGTRTYVTIGHTGGHASGVCYKCTQSDGNTCGGYCSKEADDYATYYWLWDLEDLVAVKEGELEAHAVEPYDYGEFPIPFDATEIGGGTFDPESGRLFLTAQRADDQQGQYSNPPIVMVYRID